jgi:hypothetical protein
MSRINNYDELVLERRKLEAQLADHKSIISGEVHALRQKLEPLSNIVSFFTPSKNPAPDNKLWEVGTNLGIELFVRRKLLARAGWLTKIAVPFILKRVSSRAIEQVRAVRK